MSVLLSACILKLYIIIYIKLFIAKIKPLFQRHQQNLFIKEPSVLFLNVSSRLLLNHQEWRIYVLSHIRFNQTSDSASTCRFTLQSRPSEAGRHCNCRRYCCQQLWDCCDADELINRETIKISHQYKVTMWRLSAVSAAWVKRKLKLLIWFLLRMMKFEII